MAHNLLLPPVFWFQYAFTCLRVDSMPRRVKDGPLLDLPEACRLPELVRMQEQEPWSEIRAAWNPRGLGFRITCSGKTGPFVYDEEFPEGCDGVQLWIDTRDTRDIHRGSRYCHRYSAVVVASGRSFLSVELRQRKLMRALADPTRVRADKVLSRAERRPGGWELELFFPAESLSGFDPDVNRRLGFYALVIDPTRGDQPLGPARDFPVQEDPSLWNTLELSDKTP